MRDPNRIPIILEKLKNLWLKHPDFRLGQLIYVAVRDEDLFYLEDDAMLRALARFPYGLQSLPPDILKKIESDFTLKEEQTTIKKALIEFSYSQGNYECDRLIRCILFLAKGNLEGFFDALKDANEDYRNVILWAEYDTEMNWKRFFIRPFGEETIRMEDFKNEKIPPKHDSDDLPF